MEDNNFGPGFGQNSQQDTSGENKAGAEGSVFTQQPTEREAAQSPNIYSNPAQSSSAGAFHAAEEHRKKTKKRGLVVFTAILVAAALLFTGAVTGVTLVDYYRSNEIQKSGSEPSEETGQGLPEESTKLEIEDTPQATQATGASTGEEGLETSVIAEKVKPSVVGVVGENSMNPEASAQGSGIIMSEDGYIITNNHVIEGSNKLTIVLESGEKYDAKVVGKDAKTDLAVLKINAANLQAAEFGNSDNLKVGDKAVAIGNPMGMELQGTVTQGIISAINRDILVEDRVMTLLQTDASINPGNSGGPLVNKYGQVIGINTVKIAISEYEGLGFAIPMNTAKPVIDELIAYGYVKGRPAIGISGRNMTERAANYYGVPMGVLVDSVDPASDAYAKGLREQDIIYGVNGKTITTMDEIQQVKEGMKVGESLTLNVYRGGKRLEITFALVDEATLNGGSQIQIDPDIAP